MAMLVITRWYSRLCFMESVIVFDTFTRAMSQDLPTGISPKNPVVRRELLGASQVLDSLPSGKLQKITMEHGPVEIVEFPIKNGHFPQLCETLPEGKYQVSVARSP